MIPASSPREPATPSESDDPVAALVACISDYVHPLYQDVVGGDAARIAEAVGHVLHEALKESSSQGSRALSVLDEVPASLKHQDDRVFIGSSRTRGVDDTYSNARQSLYYQRFANQTSVHLELGAWKSFPAERVKHILAIEKLADFICSDFDPQWDPDVVADATCLPFLDESVDRVASNAVFEHIAYPHESIQESFRVLRPGGVLRITTIFTYPMHSHPNDYLRYTHTFLERICKDAGFTQVFEDHKSSSGPYYTAHNLLKGTQIDPALPLEDRRAAMFLHSAVLLLLSALSPFDPFFKKGGTHIYKSVEIVAVKEGEWTARDRRKREDGPFLERNIDLLACPKTKKYVVQDGDRLVCPEGGTEYPIQNGVPIFVPLEMRY